MADISLSSFGGEGTYQVGRTSAIVLDLAMKLFRAFAAVALGLIASFSLQGCGSSDDGATGMNETTTEMMTVNTTTMETTTTMM